MGFFNQINDFVRENTGVDPAGFLEEKKNQLQEAVNSSIDYIKEIPDKGLMPVYPPTPEVEVGMTYAKGMAGVFGMPIRIQRHPLTNDYHQQTVDAATRRGDDGLVYGNDENSELKDDARNMIFGRYEGKIDLDTGDVHTSDKFNTNNPLEWYTDKVKRGEEPLVYSLAAAAKMAEETGWLNQSPRGKNVKLGTVKPYWLGL